MRIDLAELNAMQRMGWLQHAVAPRPIALVSTVDGNGTANLSPFSFFNLVSSNPPVVVFSAARRVRDNSIKHTLENVLEVPEAVIHICDYSMAQQISLSSCEYGKGVDEFVKAGFTKEAASLVRPPMVQEAKIKLECRVLEVKSLGDQGGAGQLVFAEVICMHVADEILNESGSMIDQRKIATIARLGSDWYCTVNALNLFEVPKPNVKLGIGFDQLPESIRMSKVLTGNHLGQLANSDQIPAVAPNFEDDRLRQIIQYYSINPSDMEYELHRYAAELLDQQNTAAAWQVLLSGTV